MVVAKSVSNHTVLNPPHLHREGFRIHCFDQSWRQGDDLLTMRLASGRVVKVPPASNCLPVEHAYRGCRDGNCSAAGNANATQLPTLTY